MRSREKGYPLYPPDIDYACRILKEDRSASLETIFLDAVYIPSTKKMITPKSMAQKLYVDAIRGYDIVFGIGPAGTGKTYLAMAAAIASLMEKKVNRIVLTRPAVEAGKNLVSCRETWRKKSTPTSDPFMTPFTT